MKTVLAVLLLALVGTVAGVTWWARQEPAVAATHDRAVLLFDAMETYPGTTALDQADEARRNGRVRVLVARDRAAGREIVLAVTASSSRRTNLDWWPSPNARYDATRCYRWTPDRAWGTADRVPCPRVRDVDPARAPRADPVGAEVGVLLARTLRRGGDPRVVPGAAGRDPGRGGRRRGAGRARLRQRPSRQRLPARAAPRGRDRAGVAAQRDPGGAGRGVVRPGDRVGRGPAAPAALGRAEAHTRRVRWAKAGVVLGLLLLALGFGVGIEPVSVSVAGQSYSCGSAIPTSWFAGGSPTVTAPALPRAADARCGSALRGDRWLTWVADRLGSARRPRRLDGAARDGGRTRRLRPRARRAGSRSGGSARLSRGRGPARSRTRSGSTSRGAALCSSVLTAVGESRACTDLFATGPSSACRRAHAG